MPQAPRGVHSPSVARLACFPSAVRPVLWFSKCQGYCMQLDYYPNPRAYPHHLEKNIKPRFARKKQANRPSADGNAPPLLILPRRGRWPDGPIIGIQCHCIPLFAPMDLSLPDKAIFRSIFPGNRSGSYTPRSMHHTFPHRYRDFACTRLSNFHHTSYLSRWRPSSSRNAWQGSTSLSHNA